MRQVMPHRNNIVADCRGCKTFLHPLGQSPTEFRGLLQSGRAADRGVKMPIKFIITMAYNDIAQCGGDRAATC